jgi:collagenase-like PrtC family protease
VLFAVVLANGLSPNMNGVCSPASHVVDDEVAGHNEARLGGLLIHRTPQGAPVSYPTLYKGSFTAPATETGPAQTGHIFEEPVSLNATELIPRLQKAGVTALKIEGRQRAGAPMPAGLLAKLTEGQSATTSAYAKTRR